MKLLNTRRFKVGIRTFDMNNIERAIKLLGKQMAGLRMMQFGDMDLRQYSDKPAIDYFRGLGAEVISLDISGANGSIPVDLSQRISWNCYKEYFDMITNFGTAEHVKDDKVCFDNMLYFCKPKGILINISPLEGFKYKYHKRCHFYTPEFYNEWSKTHGCNVIECRVTTKEERIDPWVLAILQKN